MLIKIVAYVLSGSLSILTSLADSGMDILSGIVLLSAQKLAEKGVPKGEYSNLPRQSAKYKFIYANRFESTGIVAFSAINAALSGSLLLTMITNIFDIINGTAAAITFSLIPILIMSFTIVLKFVLWALTEVAMR